jgi:hypothetical protein
MKKNSFRNTTLNIFSALLIPTSLIVAVSTATPAYALKQPIYIGEPGSHNGSCTVTSCNNGDGCRLTANIKDVYSQRTSCSGGLSGGGTSTCEETYRICRTIYFYDDSAPNCHGVQTGVEKQYKSSCG